MTAKFITAENAVESWRDDVLSGKTPKLFPIGDGDLSRIEIGPKRIALIGGAPGAGKTAFIMQSVVDALRRTSTLRAVVCNVEMPVDVLLDRQLARLADISLDDVRHRRLGDEHADAVDVAMGTLDEICDRLAFLRPPYDLGNVAATVDEFAPLAGDADVLIVLDYIQRIAPPGSHNDHRGRIDASMSYLRQFADAGAALIVAAAVSRSKDSKGRSSYDGDGLSLASFRESSELEFGADDAFILTPVDKDSSTRVLKCFKARHSEPADIYLDFDGSRQSFTPQSNESDGKLTSALRALWGATEPANDFEDWQG